jgi:molecular chaperone GrpE
VKEKETHNPTDIDAPRDDATMSDPSNERIYDLDTDSAEPVGLGDPDGDLVDFPTGDAGEAEPAASADSKKHGRNPLKFSRRDVLDRFQEKNTAIARLTKEKHALEKQLAVLPAEKATLEAQAKDFKDRWLRTAAEFENYRKRSAKEWELLKQQSKSEIILEVLSSLDDFERAFAAVEATDESEFVRGIRLIYNNLLLALQKLGVEEIDALGAPFDPMRHMAIGQIDTDEVVSGHVAQVAQKGYALNGSVIRPARVIVAK